MNEYRVGNAIVRMHGTPDREKIEAATVRFVKKIDRKKKQKEQKGGGTHEHG